MEFKKPKPKKNSAPKNKMQLPLKCDEEILGIFNGQFVTVCDINAMNYLYNSGNFGKGNLSKSEPCYYTKDDDIPKVMLKPQFENFVKWNETCTFCPQKSYRNDYVLSLNSIKKFFNSTFNSVEEISWKLLNEKQKLERLNMKTELNFLEFSLDKDDYVDENFSNFTSSILQRKEILKPNMPSFKPEKFIVLDANLKTEAIESSSLSSLTNVISKLEDLSNPPVENLNLSLEESFFLKSELGCLNIVDINFSKMEIPVLWEKFNTVDRNFTEKYLTYHYYRTKGWVVKSGLKYGGDYLLYKDGPAYHHASYLVKVLDRRKELTWRDFISMNRLVETFNKDLLLCQVLPSETVTKVSFPDVLSNHTIQEVLVRRWLPTKDRVAKEN